jgi:predicted nucleotidyltransferase component of viral defense system
MASPSLPPATERLWELLRVQQGLAGFVLVGGTALALRIRHRASEDLDFAFTENKLPRDRLDAVITLCKSKGLDFSHRDNPASEDEFLNAGMDLRDYQQDFLVDGSVKVSFFSADGPLTNILASRAATNGPRVAELSELFQSKALVSASRSKTRDWFDLWTLMNSHGFTMRQFRESFQANHAASLYDIALARICSGKPQADDEGFSHLIRDSAPTIEEMRNFFSAQRDALEIELATEAKQRRSKGNVP